MLRTTFYARQFNHVSKLDIRICKVLKLIFNGVCSIYIVDGLYHKIHVFPLKKCTSIIRYHNIAKRRPTKTPVLNCMTQLPLYM